MFIYIYDLKKCDLCKYNVTIKHTYTCKLFYIYFLLAVLYCMQKLEVSKLELLGLKYILTFYLFKI